MNDEQMMVAMVGTMEHDVIRSLMSGNDTQCFSTDQYLDARDKWIESVAPGCSAAALGLEEEYGRESLRGPARSQLQASRLVELAGQDIWKLRGEP